MRVIELHADGWKTAMDFVNALKTAIGAPEWHGSSPDAFVDSMIIHDEINALKSPYTIKIVSVRNAGPDAREAVQELSRLINQAGATDRGTDLEVTMVVEI
jgi:hypothetical protein